MNLSKVLLEGRRDDFIKRYRKKFNDDDMKKIFMVSRDIATNNKFLNFLGKVVFSPSIDEDLNRAKIALEKFIKYQKNLDEKDINKYMTMEDIERAITRHENRIRRSVSEVDGANIVYEDDRFTVVSPNTHEASCYYGSGSKWCTAARSSDSHFMTYNRDGKLFYFLDKKASTNDRFYKVAMLQKYNGEQQFFDAPDKKFIKGWILGTPEFDKIDKVIQKYMNDYYGDEIELFQDEIKAKQEMQRRRMRDQRLSQQRLLRRMEEYRRNDEWNLENDLDDVGRKANAVYRAILDEYVTNLAEGEDIYNLVPAADNFYPGDILAFKWLGEEENESEYIVGEWDEVYDYAKQRLEELVDDVGLFESFNNDFLMNHLDVDEVVRWFESYYDDYVRDEPESHFETEDLPLSEEQESEVERMSQEIEELYRKIASGTKEEGEVYYDKIDELESEIEDIRLDPEGEPTEEMYDEKVKDYLYDVRNNPEMYIRDFGLGENNDLIEQFIDKDSVIEDAVDMDGVGHNISFYDGNTFETRVEGVDYYVFRMD